MNPPDRSWIGKPPAFSLSIVQVVRQSIDAFVPLNVGVILEIGGDIKVRARIAPFNSSEMQIMDAWIQSRVRDILVFFQVPDWIKPWVWTSRPAIFHRPEIR